MGQPTPHLPDFRRCGLHFASQSLHGLFKISKWCSVDTFYAYTPEGSAQIDKGPEYRLETLTSQRRCKTVMVVATPTCDNVENAHALEFHYLWFCTVASFSGYMEDQSLRWNLRWRKWWLPGFHFHLLQHWPHRSQDAFLPLGSEEFPIQIQSSPAVVARQHLSKHLTTAMLVGNHGKGFMGPSEIGMWKQQWVNYVTTVWLCPKKCDVDLYVFIIV